MLVQRYVKLIRGQDSKVIVSPAFEPRTQERWQHWREHSTQIGEVDALKACRWRVVRVWTAPLPEPQFEELPR